MNPAGLVIVIAGVWITCQVFGGNALERLGILGDDPAGSGGVLPPGSVPDVTPYLPGGDRNPAVPTIPDIFGAYGFGQGRYL